MAREEAPVRAGVGEWLSFLAGRRNGILALANCRHTVWIGALFVLTAAIAREYDQEFIPRSPWLLLVPFGASLGSSFLLWLLLWLAMLRNRRKLTPFWGNYRRFLGLFWMTAPMAWLYAIPYERFLPPLDAMYANYATLGLVAAWRVFLMIRVAQVWCGRSAFGATILVLFFGDAVLFAALVLSPWPVIDMMSGNNDPVAAAEQGVLFLTLMLSFFALPASFVPVFIWACSRGSPVPPHIVSPAPMQPAGNSLLAMAAGAMLVCAVVLPFAQHEIRDKPTFEERRQVQREERRRELDRRMRELD